VFTARCELNCISLKLLFVSRGLNTIGTQQLVFFGTMFTQAFCVLIGSVKIRLKSYLFKLILSAIIKMLNCNHFHHVNRVLQFVSGYTRYCVVSS